MADTKKFDIKVKVGEYTDNGGQLKGRYRTIGAYFEGRNDDGTARPYLQLDALCVDSVLLGLHQKTIKKFEDRIFVSLFTPYEDRKPAAPDAAGAPAAASDDDQIPF